jgi:hypothetical protein
LQEVDELAPELWKSLIKSMSPSEFFEGLNADDMVVVSNWREKRSMILRDRLQKEVEAELECDTSLIRKSTPFIRLLVQTQAVASQDEKPSKVTKCEDALLTIWQPTEDQIGVLKEGATLQLQHVAVRESKYDGLVQLTANGRTYLEALESNVVPTRRLFSQSSQQWFQNLFRIHIHSHKLQGLVGEKSRLVDVDTVVVLLKVETLDSSADESLILHVTDETKLILRIHCDIVPTGLETSSWEHQCGKEGVMRILSFTNLRVLPFDLVENCAVARFCDTSILSKAASNRLDLLRNWAESGGQDTVDNVSHFMGARLSIRERHDWLTALGYIVGFKVESSASLQIEVDTGGDELQDWEFPICLLQELVFEGWEATVALCPDEERRATALGVMEKLFRARGILFRFQLRRKPETEVSANRFLVSALEVAENVRLAPILAIS